MPYFLIRFGPPRPTFIMDITDDEHDVIMQHTAYWSNLTQTESALFFGLVMDPNGVWAMVVVNARDEAAVQKLIAPDPARLANLGLSCEVLPIAQASARKTM